jgi:hypothetical protein
MLKHLDAIQAQGDRLNMIGEEKPRPGYHPDGTPKSNAEMDDDEKEDFYNDSAFINEDFSRDWLKRHAGLK